MSITWRGVNHVEWAVKNATNKTPHCNLYNGISRNFAYLSATLLFQIYLFFFWDVKSSRFSKTSTFDGAMTNLKSACIASFTDPATTTATLTSTTPILDSAIRNKCTVHVSSRISPPQIKSGGVDNQPSNRSIIATIVASRANT